MESHTQFVNKLLAAPQDVSLPILRSLFAKGYRKTKWRTNAGATDAPCISKDGDEQGLSSFISGLQHAAPIYEKTHVGCRCVIEVSGPNKPQVVVSAFGLVNSEPEVEEPVEEPAAEVVEQPKKPVTKKPAKSTVKQPEAPAPAPTKKEEPKPVATEAPKAPTLKKVIEQVKKKVGMGDQRIKKA